jgi:hypothetical protein
LGLFVVRRGCFLLLESRCDRGGAGLESAERLRLAKEGAGRADGSGWIGWTDGLDGRMDWMDGWIGWTDGLCSACYDCSPDFHTREIWNLHFVYDLFRLQQLGYQIP